MIFKYKMTRIADVDDLQLVKALINRFFKPNQSFNHVPIAINIKAIERETGKFLIKVASGHGNFNPTVSGNSTVYNELLPLFIQRFILLGAH